MRDPLQQSLSIGMIALAAFVLISVFGGGAGKFFEKKVEIGSGLYTMISRKLGRFSGRASSGEYLGQRRQYHG